MRFNYFWTKMFCSKPEKKMWKFSTNGSNCSAFLIVGSTFSLKVLNTKKAFSSPKFQYEHSLPSKTKRAILLKILHHLQAFQTDTLISRDKLLFVFEKIQSIRHRRCCTASKCSHIDEHYIYYLLLRIIINYYFCFSLLRFYFLLK